MAYKMKGSGRVYYEGDGSPINLNPKDLRTYLKFENDLFLTTNFKQDKINVVYII